VCRVVRLLPCCSTSSLTVLLGYLWQRCLNDVVCGWPSALRERCCLGMSGLVGDTLTSLSLLLCTMVWGSTTGDISYELGNVCHEECSSVQALGQQTNMHNDVCGLRGSWRSMLYRPTHPQATGVSFRRHPMSHVTAAACGGCSALRPCHSRQHGLPVCQGQCPTELLVFRMYSMLLLLGASCAIGFEGRDWPRLSGVLGCCSPACLAPRSICCCMRNERGRKHV
jgi:hypothetical protein